MALGRCACAGRGFYGLRSAVWRPRRAGVGFSLSDGLRTRSTCAECGGGNGGPAQAGRVSLPSPTFLFYSICVRRWWRVQQACRPALQRCSVAKATRLPALQPLSLQGRREESMGVVLANLAGPARFGCPGHSLSWEQGCARGVLTLSPAAALRTAASPSPGP